MNAHLLMLYFASLSSTNCLQKGGKKTLFQGSDLQRETERARLDPNHLHKGDKSNPLLQK